MTALREATYSPAVFNVHDVEQAKRIILTTEGKLTTAERWRTETPYLISLIEKSVPIYPGSIVLDYGCGIGRLSKALIDKFGCCVVGVDISPSMRALAADYVKSDRFLACAPEALSWINVGPGFDIAIAVWVLQHCHQVEIDIARIAGEMAPRGSLFVVNDRKRLVPTREHGWANDGKDVRGLLDQSLTPHDGGELDTQVMGEPIASVSYWATWRKGS